MPLIPPLLADFLRRGGGRLCQSIDGAFALSAQIPQAVLPGSFNPLHVGHCTLAEVVGRRFGCAVAFELSLTNADKPELAAEVITDRLRQFVGVGPVWVTRAAAFEKKADLFPTTSFVLGFDTAVRLIDSKYYGGESGRDAALAKLIERGCRVVVGGRADGAGVFRVWDDRFDRLRAEFRDLFEVIPEGEFRVDVSSTQLRVSAGEG